MDSITDLVSKSINKLSYDKARLNSISENNLASEIDIQLYRDLFESLKNKADKIRSANPLAKIKANINNSHHNKSSKLHSNITITNTSNNEN